MKRLRLIGLGLRLATAGGRAAWVRLAMMTIGFAVGSALLLSAASIVPALHARDARRDVTATWTRGSTGYLLMWSIPQAYGDVDISGSAVEGVGDAPVPPGLPHMPRPGEIFVSERLAESWSGPLGAALEDRLHGRLAGTIAPEEVLGPDVLTLVMGKPADVRLSRRSASRVSEFGMASTTAEPLNFTALLATSVIAAAILLPIWLFVATATRLSAATRESRLAAVRLAGGTESQVRQLAGIESGVSAVLGALLGVVLFLLVRPIVADGTIVGLRFYSTDIAPPIPVAVAILVALPVLAVAMTQAAMRRLVVSPVGVTRPARRRHAGWRWTVVLAVGLGLLGWSASQHEALADKGQSLVAVIIVVSLACIAFGLIGTAAWGAWAIASRLAQRVRSAWAMLGMRRLEAEPSSVGRVVGGVALMIAMVGVLLSGLQAVERENRAYVEVPWTASLPPDTVLAHSTYALLPGDLAAARRTPGVVSISVTNRLPYGFGTGYKGSTAVVVTDGSPATLERVRSLFAWTAEVNTPERWREQMVTDYSEVGIIGRGVMTITLFMLLVFALTMLIAMVDWIMERRRAMAVLSAVGVSRAVVRRSILSQVALPLATSVALGLAGAVTVIALLYTATETAIVIPTRQLAVLTVAVVSIVLVVTVLTTPWLRIVRKPEFLREG